MKKNILSVMLLGAAALGFTACGGGDDEPLEPNNTAQNEQGSQVDENSPSGTDESPVDGAVVTIDADGKADGTHSFIKIDDTSFYIDAIKYTIENGQLVVTGYNDELNVGDAKIVSIVKYEGKILKVVKVGQKAFYGCKSLTSVFIPNTVTFVGKDAFVDCLNIVSADINAERLYEEAFANSRVKKLHILRNVKSIQSRTFFNCSSLESITVDPENPNYKSYSDCNAIIGYSHTLLLGCKNTVIPNGVIAIGSYAFFNCHFTSINIPESVTSIGAYAFKGSYLASITIPKNVTIIDKEAFNTTHLTSVNILGNITNIGESAFKACTGLTTFTCYAKEVPKTELNAFGSFISSATLYVPAESLDAYKNTAPWSGFGTKIGI